MRHRRRSRSGTPSRSRPKEAPGVGARPRRRRVCAPSRRPVARAAPRATLHEFLSDAASSSLPSLSARGAIKLDVVLEALERDGTDGLEHHAVAVPLVRHVLADQHFSGPRIIRDPRRDVHGPAEVVAVAKDHAAGVDADARANVDQTGSLLDEVEAGEDGSTRVREVEHDPVAEPLDGMPTVRLCGLVDERREPVGQLGTGLVAALLGEGRVAGEVEEGDRRRTTLVLRNLAKLLQVLLGALNRCRYDLVLEMAAAQPEQQPL